MLATPKVGKVEDMPNIRSTIKRLRQDKKKRSHNFEYRSQISRERQKLMAAIERQDKKESEEIFREYCSRLDRAAKRGVIKSNAADRRKSRMARRIAAIAA